MGFLHLQFITSQADFTSHVNYNKTKQNKTQTIKKKASEHEGGLNKEYLQKSLKSGSSLSKLLILYLYEEQEPLTGWKVWNRIEQNRIYTEEVGSCS